MVWSAFWQVGAPAVAFYLYEQKAWDDRVLGTQSKKYDRTKKDHFTDKVTAWEHIMYGSMFTWGPMFLLGVVALSDGLGLATARLIEHWVSNLMHPMYLYSFYLLFGVGVQTGDWKQYGILVLWLIVSLSAIDAQVTNGAGAMKFLYGGYSKYDDLYLRPSIFYMLGWIEHEKIDYA